MASVLPPAEDAARYVPRPGGPVWRAASDVRILPAASYALLLQVAHPTVGAGVAEHSDFRADPWGRLLRTLDYVHGSIYGGPEMAAAIGRRVREMHRTITGVTPDGERYHAMEPVAYAWVHATLASAFVDGHRLLGTPMAPWEQQAFWREWKRMGRLIGVRDGDLPDDWADFGSYFDRMIAEELRDNPTVHIVLDTLAAPKAPPLPGVSPGLWRVVRWPATTQARFMLVGLLPPALRDKLGLEWTPGQERRFRAAAALSRAARPAIRGPLGEFGPHYVQWRAAALARGDVARPRDAAPAAHATAA